MVSTKHSKLGTLVALEIPAEDINCTWPVNLCCIVGRSDWDLRCDYNWSEDLGESNLVVKSQRRYVLLRF